MDPSSLRVSQNAYFVLLARIKKLLLSTYCDMTLRIGNVTEWTGRDDHEAKRTDRHEC